jgi:hypothetical protein
VSRVLTDFMAVNIMSNTAQRIAIQDMAEENNLARLEQPELKLEGNEHLLPFNTGLLKADFYYGQEIIEE